MQYPLPSVGPTAPPAAPHSAQIQLTPINPVTQQVQPNQGQWVATDPTKPFRAWYPRWWLLSAMLCAVLVGGILLLQSLGCKGRFANSFPCQFGNWPDWRQEATVVIVWAVFLLGWLILYVSCVTPIEFKHSRAAWPRLLGSLSHFRAVYSLLYIYAGLAFCAIILMWIVKAIRPLPFAICTIIVFVANAQFFHRIRPQQRRRYLLSYGILALVGIIVMLVFGLYQFILFSTESVLVLVGGWATFSLVRNKWEEDDQNVPLDEAERMAASNAKALEPGEIIRDLFRAIFRHGSK